MSARTSIFSLLLLTAVTGAFAQSQAAAADPLPSRPLNLSVRKPSATPASTVLILPDQAVPASSVATEDEIVPADLPYGAGYENRQQSSKAGSGSATGSGNSGSSGGSGGGNGGGGSGGGGGGGRGGSGRGR